MRSETQRLVRGAVIAAAVVAAVACASTPVPNEKIAVAQESVRRAEQSGAPQLAPVELSTAREKLSRAQKAAADHDAVPANALAEQADVDARLAEATAQQQHAHQAAAEFDASMQALRQESLRPSQPTTP